MRTAAVLTGCVLATAGWALLLGVWLGQELSDSAGPVNVWRDAGLALLVAAGLLAVRRTRRAGAGLMFGLTVTTVVWAGLCMAIAAVNLVTGR